MLVLRTSNFQGATIRPIVPRHRHYCLYCSPLNFPVAGAACLKTENDKNLFIKISNRSMERLGVSYSPLYPLQMIFHLYMYKQFYMLTVDFNIILKKKPSEEETSNLETCAPA